MEDLGRPVLASGVHKVEQGERRVDADELVAFALALEVAPNRLLLPGEVPAYDDDEDDAVALTPTRRVRARTAWYWATGDGPLTNHPDPGEAYRFSKVNRPHDPRRPTYAEEYVRHKEALEPVTQALTEALKAGVPLRVIKAMIDIFYQSQRM
ncbi:hypothetical protein [Acrocarpospora sp. B8E8]|uniref:hypothetical protein n=1 Tax=Acrocarpospora sp. B8E8 TaxID=3153572 RepID=UPI00325E4346